MPVPGWFQATDYFYNKLDQMQVADPAYEADQLAQAFSEAGYSVPGVSGAQLAASADNLFRHFNEYGNAENVSPNNYFDVATYRANKLAQVKESGQAVPAGFNAWSEEALDAAMKDAGLSYWDHYIQYGTAEGINPSAEFDTEAYLTAKANQLNSLPEGQQQPLPDGTLGEWNPALVAQALQQAGLNAIEHYYDYGIAEGVKYTPETETPANTVELKPGADILADNGVATNFVGEVATSQSKSTFNQDDQITGSDADDALTLAMSASFQGMNRGGFVTDVETVNLANNTGRDLNFNVKGIDGVATYNVDGAVNLQNVDQTGIEVNYSNVHTSSNLVVGFASGVNSGPDDSLTIGLDEVYVPGNATKTGANNDQPATAVSLVAAAIEDVTVNSTGTHGNNVNLDGMNYMRSLTIAGDADLKAAVTNRNTDLTSIDGSAAKGDLDLSINSGERLSRVALGEGNDRLVADNISATASIDGGAGDDLLTLRGASGNYALTTSDVETLGLKGGGARIGLIGENMDGVENLLLDGVSNGSQVTLAEFPNSSLNVQAVGGNSVNLTVAGIPDMNIQVGDGKDGADYLAGTITLGAATNLSINVDDGLNAAPVFNAQVNASQVNYLDINAASGSSAQIGGGSNLSNLSNVDVSGSGVVSLAGNVGTKSRSLYVNTEDMSGGSFEGYFAGSDIQNSSFTLQGSNLADHYITVGAGYEDIDITTGMGDEEIVIYAKDGERLDTTNLKVDLGGGANTVIIEGRIALNSNLSGITGASRVTLASYNGDELAGADFGIDNVVPGAAGSNTPPAYPPVSSGTQEIAPAPDQPVKLNRTDAPVTNLDLTLDGGADNQGTSQVSGTVAPGGQLTVNGSANTGIAMNFGNTPQDVKTDGAQSVTAQGSSSQPNNFTGTIANVAQADITTGTTDDEVDLQVTQTAGQTTSVNNTAGAEVTNLVNNGAGTLEYTGANTGSVSNTAAGSLVLNSTAADATQAIVANNSGTGEVTVNTNANASAQAVNLNVTNGTATVDASGATVAQQVNVTGDVTAGDGLSLTGNSNTTFVVDAGSGSDMSGLSALTVTGASTTTVNDLTLATPTFALTTDSNTQFADTDMASVNTLSVTNTNSSGTVEISGKPADPVAGTLDKVLGFDNVTDIIFDGAGKTVLNAQIGTSTNTSTDLQISAEGTGGVTIGGAGISARGAIFTGSDKADALVLSPTAAGPYTMNLGNGSDFLQVQVGFGSGNTEEKSTVTVDLGTNGVADGVQDTLSFWTQSIDYTPKNGVLLQVKGFDLGMDKLAKANITDESGTPAYNQGSFITWNASDQTKLTTDMVNAIKVFDSSFAGVASNTDCIMDASKQVLLVGNNAYALWSKSSSYTVSDVDFDIDGCALVQIMGVTGATAAQLATIISATPMDFPA